MKVKFFLGLIFLGALLSSCRDILQEPLHIEQPRMAQVLKVYSPVTGDVFYNRDTVVVKWKVLSKMKYANLKLYKKSDYRMTIASKIPNTGSYSWYIPDFVPQSHHYKIRVADHDEPSRFADSEVFFILTK